MGGSISIQITEQIEIRTNVKKYKLSTVSISSRYNTLDIRLCHTHTHHTHKRTYAYTHTHTHIYKHKHAHIPTYTYTFTIAHDISHHTTDTITHPVHLITYSFFFCACDKDIYI